MPFFFAQREGGRAVITGRDARHLARSLRARVGEQIEVVDPAGLLLTVRLDHVATDRVEGVVVAETKHRPEPGVRITMAIANIPAAALELALSKCTEAGAFSFLVFQADRSVARGARPERWAAICRESSMLAGRLRVPEVAYSGALEQVLATAVAPLMLSRDASVKLSDVREPRDTTLLIGPEGGWSERELALAPRTATLGPRNLRADTAAIVALAVALAGRDSATGH